MIDFNEELIKRMKKNNLPMYSLNKEQLNLLNEITKELVREMLMERIVENE